MENRPSDKAVLPKRLRFYEGITDDKNLPSNTSYDELPDFISITISSYDPFGAGSMYYEARTTLITHPEIQYNDGLTHIFLYCNGKLTSDNLGTIASSPEHRKKLTEMLKYILTGQKPDECNLEIEQIDSIVTKVKTKSEVTKAYMKQWDRERSLQIEAAREEGKKNALNMIKFCRENNISDEKIRLNLHSDYKYDDQAIDALFMQVSSEEK